MLFAALRFYKDANLADRTYWYLSDFPVKEGERVFAPVGVHDRVQRAVVERVKNASEEDAPYDLSYVKKLAGAFPSPTFAVGEFSCRDLGGIAYDEKHYTRFNRVFYAQRGAAPSGLFTDIIEYDTPLPPLGEKSRVLIAGERAKEYAEGVILAARGKEAEARFKALSELLK